MWYQHDMVSNMKTTIDIADELFLRTKAAAFERGMSFRNMVMLGLSLALESEVKAVKIKPVTFQGNGLTPEFQNAGWSQIRDAAYGEPST